MSDGIRIDYLITYIIEPPSNDAPGDEWKDL